MVLKPRPRQLSQASMIKSWTEDGLKSTSLTPEEEVAVEEAAVTVAVAAAATAEEEEEDMVEAVTVVRAVAMEVREVMAVKATERHLPTIV
jgi:hypothetical protein